MFENQPGELPRIILGPGVGFGSPVLTPWDDLLLIRRDDSIVLWRHLDDTIVYEVPIDDEQKYGDLTRNNGYGWIPGQPKFFIIDNQGNVEVWDVSSVIHLPKESST